MYRLICPLVDAAIAPSSLFPYFEYSKANAVNSAHHIDIAILHCAPPHAPTLYIEAKKYSEPICARMVLKYLVDDPCPCGVVSNGNDWIFCLNDRAYHVGPLLRRDGTVNREIEARVLACLASPMMAVDYRFREVEYDTPIRSDGPPILRCVGKRTERLFLPKEDLGTRLRIPEERASALSQPTAEFIKCLREQFPEVPFGRVSLSGNRLVWNANDGGRFLRINLMSRGFDCIVHRSMLDFGQADGSGVVLELHSKSKDFRTVKIAGSAGMRDFVRLLSIGAQRIHAAQSGGSSDIGSR
jgi:hypothetical protein